MFFTAVLGLAVLPIIWSVYNLVVLPLTSPLRHLPGPPTQGWFGLGGHLRSVLSVSKSKATHEEFVKKYGKNVRIKGVANWEDRLLTTDPVAIAHVLNHTVDYEKPWQSRRVINRLIGEGMLSTEGQVHKRMRRVGNPAFSVQNMRALVPLVFSTGQELRDKWFELSSQHEQDGSQSKRKDIASKGLKLDVCMWVSRATFDIIGLAGFDYRFNAIQSESNDLFLAFKDMFEIAVSQSGGLWDIIIIYLPWLEWIFPNEQTRIVKKSRNTIYTTGRALVEDKKKRILEGEKNGTDYTGTDLLTHLLKSNMSTEISPNQRISDDEILHNVNTFLFAGSDTTSLALTWTLLALASYPSMQKRLRAELQEFSSAHAFDPASSNFPAPGDSETWKELHTALDELPYLNNVIRENIRVIPPVHSSIRVATKDDEIPTSEAIRMKDGSIKWGVKIRKGQFVHLPVESMNLDKGVWGEDAWNFNPDRWEKLPDAVLEQPGLFNHTLSFSGGPRGCIGLRMSMMEMKTFLYFLISNFNFSVDPQDKISAVNVVLTRPYVRGKFEEGSQCPLIISRYVTS